MALTTQQLQTLKAAIAADPTLSQIPHTADGAFDVAAAMNLPAAPDFFVWLTSVVVTGLMQGNFDWTRVDNLTVGKSRIWEFMTASVSVDPSQPNVRAGFLATFSVAADLATRQAIFTNSVRKSRRCEKLYATGTGAAPTDQGVGPATMAFEGQLTYQDVLQAWATS